MISNCLSIRDGHLFIDDCDTVELARKYGTPVYLMSETKIREVCRTFADALNEEYSNNPTPIYASKACCCKELLRVISSEGFDIEVNSGGELYTAIKADIPMSTIHLNGSNKSKKELLMAIENNVGQIAVDNIAELNNIEKIASKLGKKVKISLRVRPGVKPHTHEYIQTGQIDSKFGLSVDTNEALEAIELASELKHIEIDCLHCHIGSQILEIEPFVLAAEIMIRLMDKANKSFGTLINTLNLGGGFGIKYVEEDNTIPFNEYIEAVSKKIHATADELGINVPRIMIEPGRSVVGEAGITLHTVGNIKEIPDIRNYVQVDGGMFENIRHALYKAEYTVILANKANIKANYKATIAGKTCESSDIIQKDVMIAKPEEGDILAVMSTGAYNYSMASNYNRNTRPGIVMINGTESRYIVKPETYEDLIKNDC